jgi:pyroglutamyl-peptidase
VNLADAELPDNAGAAPLDAPVVAGGPVAFAATLPLRRIARAIAEAGIKVRLSNSAGTFLCNAALYHLLAAIARQGRDIPCGFIHLPDLPEQAGQGAPAMEFAMMERALALALQACGAATARDPGLQG